MRRLVLVSTLLATVNACGQSGPPAGDLVFRACVNLAQQAPKPHDRYFRYVKDFYGPTVDDLTEAAEKNQRWERLRNDVERLYSPDNPAPPLHPVTLYRDMRRECAKGGLRFSEIPKGL